MHKAICTVISKNYLASARTLAQSIAIYHPEIAFYVLLVDKVDGKFDICEEKFEMLLAEDLDNIPKKSEFFFKYSIIELNTAVKPFFFDYLLTRYGIEKLIYFDPDIVVFSRLDRIWDLLDEHSAVVTPHMTAPIDDGCMPSELDILRAGVYNLGFIGMAAGEQLTPFLRWWQERLRDHCVVDHNRGYFVDQKWVDIAPLLFPGFFTLSDPTCNIAYWNFHDRAARVRLAEDNRALFDKRPVTFFHFSGFDPFKPNVISKHQNRFTFEDRPNLRPLFQWYRERLLANGYAVTHHLPYAYANFDNGVLIPSIARRLYREEGEEASRFGNPFLAQGPTSFFHWLGENRPCGGNGGGSTPSSDDLAASVAAEPAGGVPRLWWEIYQSRPDLQRTFPDPCHADREAYLNWVRRRGLPVYSDVDPVFVPLPATPIAPAAAPRAEDTPAPPVRAGANPFLMQQRFAHAGHATKMVILNAFKHDPRMVARLVRLKRRLRGLPPPSTKATFEAHEGVVTPFASALPFGVNVSGFLAGEFGVAEASRGLIHALRTAEVPYALNNVDSGVHRTQDVTFTEFSDENPYRTNLVTVSVDVLGHFLAQKAPDYLSNRRNIAVWYWELSRFPEKWRSYFDHFHEIWVTSAFCAEAIGQVSPIPVVKMTHPLVLDEALVRPGRARFNLPPEPYLFLVYFDYRSIWERKNPLAVVRAFREAFGGSKDALLIVKSINADFDRDNAYLLEQAAEGLNVHFLDGHLERGDLLSLFATADCLVSLHRSEGLGLGIAEAMYLGKPVVATAYSGNMDFMTINNSFPVKYALTELTEDYGPYEAGNVWADPDITHAAEQMRHVYENRDDARRVGQRAAQDIKMRMNPVVAGQEMRERLQRHSST